MENEWTAAASACCTLEVGQGQSQDTKEVLVFLHRTYKDSVSYDQDRSLCWNVVICRSYVVVKANALLVELKECNCCWPERATIRNGTRVELSNNKTNDGEVNGLSQ